MTRDRNRQGTRGATVGTVTIDGHAVANPDDRQTNRGLEVSVPVSDTEPHTMTVTTP